MASSAPPASPGSSQGLARYQNLLLPAAIFFLAIAARLLPGPRTIDDAFITYRYARNILEGSGFLYNPGEHVLGTTTPLYTALMVAQAIFTGGAQAPFPQLALLTNALADGLSCLLLLALGRRLGSALAGCGAALVWAIAPFSVTFAIGGLETSVYVLLLLAVSSAHLEGQHKLAAFLAALALLTRPDALILIGPIFLDRAWQLFQDTRRAGRAALDLRALTGEALAFGLPALLWIGFAWLYFGSPIPHSITAKSLAYRLGAEAGFIRLLQHYSTPFLEQITFGAAGIALGFVLYPALYLLGSLQALRQSRRIWPFLAYPWLYFAAFAIANPLIFRWYLTPPLPALILVILTGADRLLCDLGKALQRGKATSRPGPAGQTSRLATAVRMGVVILLPFLLSLRGWQTLPDHGLQRPAPEMAWYKLELLYHEAAGLLSAEIEQRGQELPTLAAGDVGVLGFHTPTRILDTVGLNSPQSTDYYPLDPQYYVINYAIPPELILDNRPDYVILLEVYGRKGLLKDARFLENYRLLYKLPTDIYGSDGMLVYARNQP
jgi:hypothetical protein